MINEYLKDLISRMNDNSVESSGLPYKSEDTISFPAYREAEKLTSKEYLKELIPFIDIQKDKKIKKAAYFILGKISKNTNDEDGLVYLISRVKYESDKYILSTILSLIKDLDKPSYIDIEPLLNAIHDNRWQVKQEAILSLKNTHHKKAQDTLLDLLVHFDDKKDKYEVIYTISTLGSIANKDAIFALDKKLSSKIKDIKIAAKYAIESINKRFSS